MCLLSASLFEILIFRTKVSGETAHTLLQIWARRIGEASPISTRPDFCRDIIPLEISRPYLLYWSHPILFRMFFDAAKATNFVIENEEEAEPNTLAGKTSDMIFPSPESKEFILRTVASRPFCYSAPCPQRMYAMIRENEFRLAGAFSIDKQFL